MLSRLYNYPLLFAKTISYGRVQIGSFIAELGSKIDMSGSFLSEDIAHLQRFSRHRKISSINEIQPQIGDSFIAENASILGDVRISSNSNIGHNVVMRAELVPIR